MADTAKYTPINGGKTLLTDLKTHVSFLKTKRTVTCAYGFMFVSFLSLSWLLVLPPTLLLHGSDIFSLSSSSSTSGTYSDKFKILLTPDPKTPLLSHPIWISWVLVNETLKNGSQDKVEVLKALEATVNVTAVAPI
ncbi:hypothetical protein HAX54_031932 [Datura stramonium]|uniref:Uncharacterized protein n=1 Tax=Datura stramonium TaxID=4076 RepID=A0ABS8SC92_DATST|nr:hypothetical protein [Datura stramonium]